MWLHKVLHNASRGILRTTTIHIMNLGLSQAFLQTLHEA